MILAAGRNEPEIVSLLAQLEYGMRNKHGYTALMAAAMYDSDECCRILLPLEQDLRLRDGGTAIMVAAAVGSVNAFNVLFLPWGFHRHSWAWSSFGGCQCRPIRNRKANITAEWKLPHTEIALICGLRFR